MNGVRGAGCSRTPKPLLGPVAPTPTRTPATRPDPAVTVVREPFGSATRTAADARCRTRTCNPLITNQVLYQLSQAGLAGASLTPSMPLRRLAPALLAALALAGCGGGDEKESSSAPEATVAATEQAPAAPGKISTDLKSEPMVPKPSGQPPAGLVKKDLVKGKGPKAKPGDLLSVQYTGVSFSTGQKFDASWDRGAEPFQFQLGAGMVIPGWDKGVPGMRVGGRRELIIPAPLAYGAQGSPPSIGPNETLIFVVDLVKIS